MTKGKNKQKEIYFGMFCLDTHKLSGASIPEEIIFDPQEFYALQESGKEQLKSEGSKLENIALLFSEDFKDMAGKIKTLLGD